MSDMQQTSHQPAGFCPQCGYAIDPGRCPECAAVVDKESLRSEPPAFRRRRWIKRVSLVVLVTMLFGGVYWGYRNTPWIQYVPASWLLGFQTTEADTTAIELARRFSAGELSDEQARRMFETAISLELDVPDPYPSDIELIASVVGRLNLPLSKLRVRVTEPRMTLDGDSSVAFQPGRSITMPSRLKPYASSPQTFSPLEAGPHELTARAEVSIWSAHFGDATSHYKTTRSATAEFEVVDQPVSAFIASEFNDELSSEMTGVWSLIIKGRSHHQLYVDRPPVAGVFDLYVRPRPGGAFARRDSNSLPLFMFAGAGAGFVGVLGEVDWPRPEGEGLDIRLVPNPASVLFFELDSYFNGVIEWTDVRGPAEGEDEIRIPPTRVYEYHPALMRDLEKSQGK